ncbi:copper resistance protein [Erwinia sp. HR93]|uniref:copper resistance protein n=1 Tax=Erwinia sp. HR93 TaxID=3094840 RepID=UPI002ADED8D3|nr:copper resistance protein [Erwinia sp. HR93]MEA1063476.1 copper resistance protein [Erwinia sp. HR93]
MKQRRIATWFLGLACLVVLVCTAQRMAALHAFGSQPGAVIAQVSPQGDGADAPVTPCELSAKSLLSVPPLLFEGAVITLMLLLALLAPRPQRRRVPPPPRVISPHTLRVHLRLCVFRE